MTNDSGQLSLDFIIGFAIFMVGFIFVATLLSGLLIGLQTKTIDYDAVAYRTGVILVEDPGEPADWQTLNLKFESEKDKIKRLGLSISKDYPNILLQSKVDKFFNSAKSPSCTITGQLCNPIDYTSRLMIFGDYTYRFNITIKNLTGHSNYNATVGEPLPHHAGAAGEPVPDQYGYIRRVVQIKEQNIANLTLYNESIPSQQSNTSVIYFNFNSLINATPIFRINPLDEDIIINLTNISAPTNLTDICVQDLLAGGTCISPDSHFPTVHLLNSGIEQPLGGNISVNNSTVILIDAGYFKKIGAGSASQYNIRLAFDNTTIGSASPVDYGGIVISRFFPAVLEVSIW